MPYKDYVQPQIIITNNELRLRAYDGNYKQAIPWYQDEVVYYSSEGITDPSKMPDESYVKRTYEYLNSNEDMPVFPGTEQPILQNTNTIESDGFREKKIMMYSHTGTHIDAPAHMIGDGLCLDDFEVDKFIGKAAIFDFSNVHEKLIDVDSLLPYKEKIKKVDFIIIKTGWSKYWGGKKYFEDFPYLSEEAAVWLTGFNLKGIGIDVISIDSIKSITFAVHKTLMPRDIIIIENLTNLDSISSDYFILSIMPLKIKNSDGSPIRAIAIESI